MHRHLPLLLKDHVHGLPEGHLAEPRDVVGVELEVLGGGVRVGLEGLSGEEGRACDDVVGVELEVLGGGIGVGLEGLSGEEGRARDDAG